MLTDGQYRDIVREYGTPLYVFDIGILREHVLMLKSMLAKNISLCYAVKANPFLIPYLMDIVDRFGVCSQGEYRICEHYGVPTKKILLSGVVKDKSDIDYIVSKKGAFIYTAESLRQYIFLRDAAHRHGISINVILRITNGSQFGMDILDAFRILEDSKGTDVNIIGLHYFTGTQKKNPEFVSKELKELEQSAEKLTAKGAHISLVEYGPGLFVDYYGKSDRYELLRNEMKIIEPYAQKYDITIEMGRFIAAFCGSYITTVVDKKINNRTGICLIDGGINHLSYSGWMTGMKTPKYASLHTEASEEYDCRMAEYWELCGSLCTANDIILKNEDLSHIEVGDIFIFSECGAYSVTEALYLFLSHDLPMVVAIDEDRKIQVLRTARSTYCINESEKQREQL